MIRNISKVDWNENFKLRMRRNASIKHEVIKLQIVLALLEKYKKNLNWIRIYTEYPVGNENELTKFTDVYFQNIKTKEIICYEVQNNISDTWLKNTKDFYENYDDIFCKTDWVLVKENELSDDIEILQTEIKKIII